MKILYVEASSGQVVGGSLTGVLHLIAGLDRSRYTPTLVLYEDKRVIKSLLARGVRVRVFSKRRLPKEHGLQEVSAYKSAKGYLGVTTLLRNLRVSVTFLFETLPAARRLARLLREEAPDIVHVCNGFRGNMDAIVAARMCGIPCVVHCKGFDKHGYIERLAAPGVASVICMTRAIEDHCRADGMNPPYYNVVYDGLDLDEFRPTRGSDDVREELGIDLSAPVVGVVGNIQEWKGQRVLLEVMVDLVKTNPNAVALIVGAAHRSGRNYADSLQRFVVENGLGGNVIFTGERDDVGDVMNCMDVVAHTSVRGEPFGRVIIEGMCVGKPVVATRAGGVPEFVNDGENGVLVPAGDATALASILCRLFGEPALRERLSRGALKSVEDFSVEHHVGEVTSIYHRIATRYGIPMPALSEPERRIPVPGRRA